MTEVFHLDKTKRYADQRDLHLAFVKKHLTIEDNWKILDIGCGLGEFLESITNPTITKHGIDLDPECVSITREHVPEAQIRLADAEQLPYEDNTFDYVNSLFILEHVENPSAHAREALRVLKTGGKALFATPNIARLERVWYSIVGKERFERSGHRQGYCPHLLRHFLENLGWTVDRIETRFVDAPLYYHLPRWLGNWLSKKLLPRFFSRIGSELYAFCHKE